MLMFKLLFDKWVMVCVCVCVCGDEENSMWVHVVFCVVFQRQIMKTNVYDSDKDVSVCARLCVYLAK